MQQGNEMVKLLNDRQIELAIYNSFLEKLPFDLTSNESIEIVDSILTRSDEYGFRIGRAKLLDKIALLAHHIPIEYFSEDVLSREDFRKLVFANELMIPYLIVDIFGDNEESIAPIEE